MRYEPSSQPLVLVIDPDAAARALVRHAVQSQSDALVLEAHDALSGIDLVTEHGAHVQLVILDVQQPDLDGYDLCLRIRDIGAQQRTRIAILPFAAPGVQEQLLAELGCAPPCYKPASVEQLTAALHYALEVREPMPHTSQLLMHARQRAVVAEQHARRQRIGTIALLASALPARLSLHYLLTSARVSIVAEAPSARLLEHIFEQQRVQLLVTDADDRHGAVELAVRMHIPLLVVATAREHCQALATDVPFLTQVQGIVDATDEQAPLVLAAAVAAVTSGERFVYLPQPHNTSPAEHLVPEVVTQALAQVGLTRRERELLWLDMQGWSSAQIAARLSVAEVSLLSYWKRLQRKLGADRSGVRAWLRQEIRGLTESRAVVIGEHDGLP